jgi:hypothetical protein
MEMSSERRKDFNLTESLSQFISDFELDQGKPADVTNIQ